MGDTVAFVYAHPDDEAFLSAALIRRLADEGHRPVLLLATKGDAGGRNGYAAHLGREELGELRVEEMTRAGELMGIAHIEHLGYPDGLLDTADETEAVSRTVRFLREQRASVVVTFPENGGNGHRDHIAISRIATAAVLSGECASVRKLYFAAAPSGDPEAEGVPSAAVRLDTEPYWPVKAAALAAHRSQRLAVERVFGKLDKFPEDRRYELFVLRRAAGQDWPEREERSVLDGLGGSGE